MGVVTGRILLVGVAVGGLGAVAAFSMASIAARTTGNPWSTPSRPHSPPVKAPPPEQSASLSDDELWARVGENFAESERLRSEWMRDQVVVTGNMGAPLGAPIERFAEAFPEAACWVPEVADETAQTRGRFLQCDLEYPHREACPAPVTCTGASYYFLNRALVGFSLKVGEGDWRAMARSTRDAYGEPAVKLLPAGPMTTEVLEWQIPAGRLSFLWHHGFDIYGAAIPDIGDIQFGHP